MKEDFEVEHSYARVLRQGDGSFILQSEERATFEVLDADNWMLDALDKLRKDDFKFTLNKNLSSQVDDL